MIIIKIIIKNNNNNKTISIAPQHSQGKGAVYEFKDLPVMVVIRLLEKMGFELVFKCFQR